MNRNIVLELFLIALVALFWIPGTSAFPQYLDAYNTTFNTNGSCSICHVNPADGGTRTPYGMQFENQSNHATDPGAALAAIGPAPGTTPGTTSTAMATATAIATSVVTAVSTATQNVTEAPIVTTTTTIPIETPIITETPVVIETTIVPAVTTPAPRTPGFELGVFIAGLLACYLILKRHNNN